MGVKFVDVVQGPDHVARFIEDDDAARTRHRSGGGEGIEIHRDFVKRHFLFGHRAVRLFQFEFETLVGAQNFRRTSAGNDGLDLPPVTRAARHIVNELTHRDRAHFDLEITGPLHVAAHTNDPGAGVVRPAEAGVTAAAHFDDVLHVAEGLDVVHDCRAHVEAEHRREIRRLDSWISALAFERFDQPGFFAADVSAGAAMNVNLDVEPGAEHVAPHEIFLARFLDRALEDLRAFRKLAADVDVGRLRAERETGDQDSLDQLVGILVNNVAVLECPRLRFIGVADQVDRLFFVGLDKAPFHAAGKPGAAAAPQARSLHFVHDFRARHLDRLLQRLVAAVAQVAIDVGGVIRAADVFENEAVLEGVRGGLRFDV